MNEFWRKATSPENVAGPLTEEALYKALEDMRKPPQIHPVILPPGLKK